jgi:hypothetical protein
MQIKFVTTLWVFSSACVGCLGDIDEGGVLVGKGPRPNNEVSIT